MQTRQLFINSFSVDFFSDDEPLPLILQVNDLGDLQSLQGNGSKAFKLPLTQKNREIFGFPDDLTITTNAPYTQLPAKYIVDGIEIISNGIAEIIDTQDGKNGFIDIQLLFGNIDLLDKLGGQIYDMGDSSSLYSDYGTNLVWNQYSLPVPGNLADISNCIWDVPHAAYSQKKTDGWIWPIVNYGDIDIIYPFTGLVNVRNLRPGFFLHTAISLLIQSTGYTINQDKSIIYNDPDFANLYQKLIIQFSNSDFEHGSDWQNTPDNLGALYNKGTNQVINNPRKPINTSNYIYDNQFPFAGVISFGPSDHYTAEREVSFTATIQFDMFISGSFTGSQPSELLVMFTLVTAIDGSLTDFASTSITMDDAATRISGSGGSEIRHEYFYGKKISYDFTLQTGDQLYVRYHINNIGQHGQDQSSTYVVIYKGATFTIVTDEQIVLFGQPIQCERILPNISQLDLLKDVLQKFGLILIADPNSGTVTFTSFRVIVANIPIARDWSDKCKDMGKKTVFQLGNYTQINWLRYPQDDTIPVNYMPKYFADDKITIADATLSPTQPVQDLFTSIFSPSVNSPYIGGSIAQMSDPTSTETYSPPGQPRLLIDEKLDISSLGNGGQSFVVTFTDNDLGFQTVEISINDVISVPYFYKPDGDFNLCYSDKGTLAGLKSMYFPELQSILTQAKKITRYFYLIPADIVNFDFTIPVYLRQDSAYFYVSKIDSWTKGNPVKVDLIKIS